MPLLPAPLLPAEAALLDPQQRVLLEEASGLLGQPDASFTASSGSTQQHLQQTAVAVGIAKLGEPAAVVAGNAAAVAAGSSYVGTGRALSVAAGRLSYCYGLRGQAVSVDTACSSSLVALHFAAGAITAGTATRGLGAGVNLPMNWETTSMFTAAGGCQAMLCACMIYGILVVLLLIQRVCQDCLNQAIVPVPGGCCYKVHCTHCLKTVCWLQFLAGMIAQDGRCKTLDAAADGYTRSEAAVLLLLESAAAWANGSHIGSTGRAVALLVGGIAVNQDGRSSSLTAPHGPSQQAVVLAAVGAAGLSPVDLHAVEIHGTGGW